MAVQQRHNFFADTAPKVHSAPIHKHGTHIACKHMCDITLSLPRVLSHDYSPFWGARKRPFFCPVFFFVIQHETYGLAEINTFSSAILWHSSQKSRPIFTYLILKDTTVVTSLSCNTPSYSPLFWVTQSD